MHKWGSHISMDPIPDAEFKPLSAISNKSQGSADAFPVRPTYFLRWYEYFLFLSLFRWYKKNKSTFSSYSHTFLSAYFFVLFLLGFFGCLAWLYFLPFNFVSLISSQHSRISLDSCKISFSFFPFSPFPSVAVLSQKFSLFPISDFNNFNNLEEELICVDPINHPDSAAPAPDLWSLRHPMCSITRMYWF